MNKKWQFYKVEDAKVDEISKKYNINKILATILVNRNLVEDNDVRTFLNPTRNDFHDPYMMPDMEKAVGRILEVIKNKEKVIIYGDYDVDGITSTTVLKSFLQDRGLIVDEYIPNRLDEGYGLNKQALELIAYKKYDLMITVDCGISAIEEVDYANQLGLEIIITDHHEAGEKLPDAFAVIDAKRKDNKYPFRDLAGVGVVFKLIQAIGLRLQIDEKEYLKYLDMVCVGTISDIVPLVDENRVIAKLGLKLIEQTRNFGLRAMINSLGFTKIDSTTISFGVAPRINACGRMGCQEEALRLFLSKDIDEVNQLINQLNDHNKNRQEIERRIYNEAIEQIEKNELNKHRTIVVGGENWHHGVIGIVASKITELYFKPTILLCFEEDGVGKGSGRSIPGFDLYETLSRCNDMLLKFGGHSMAIGVNISKEKLEEFRKQFEEIAEEQKIEEIIPIINIDEVINLNEIDIEMIKSLSVLEPFGEKNKTPLFACKNLKIDSIRALSEGKHLKLTLRDNNNIVNAIGFNMGHLSEEYLIGDKVDVVGVLEVNSFNGMDNIQINMKDMMRSI